VIAVSKAIHMFRFGKVDPSQFNDQLKDMYSWSNVAERTEKVYGSIYQTKNSPLIERLRRYYGCGVYAGKIFCMVMALDYLIWKFLEWIFPTSSIEKAQVFPYQKYRQYFQEGDVNHPGSTRRHGDTMLQLVEEDEDEEE
jgi:phosphatidylinositol glycan class A protein